MECLWIVIVVGCNDLKILSFVFEYIAFCFVGGIAISSLCSFYDAEKQEVIFVQDGRCSIRVYM